jgi:1-acyl-sn-glycerol-3-phosphate acyltransferase
MRYLTEAETHVPAPGRSPRYWLGSAILKVLGWRVEGRVPNARKYVIIAAPHTSNWDTLIMISVSYVMGVRLSFLMKDSMFRWPFGGFFRWLGGIGVDRSSRNNTVEQCVQKIREADEMALSISPEGTRSRVRYWKTGFYYIALGAGVPVVLGFLDYKRKVGGMGPVVIPSGDLRADLVEMQGFFANMQGKHPHLSGDMQLPEDEGPPRSTAS